MNWTVWPPDVASIRGRGDNGLNSLQAMPTGPVSRSFQPAPDDCVQFAERRRAGLGT